MTIDINRLEMRSSSKFYLFYLRCASRLSGIVIALWHTFGHPLYIQSNETGELSQWLCNDNSTINIGIGIITNITTATGCVCMADGGDGLMPLLASIREMPCDMSAPVGDDPFCRFISLRNSTITTTDVSSPALTNASASVLSHG